MLAESSPSQSQLRNNSLRPAAFSPERIAAAKARLEHDGLTASEWARRNGYSDSIPFVNKILAGTRKCRHGKGREIAIKLGLVDV